MELSHKEFRIEYKRKQAKEKRRVWLAILILVLVFLLSLCFRTVFFGFIPKETFINLWTYIKLTCSQIFGTSYSLDAESIIANSDYYAETQIRLFISVYTLFGGMALGLAGAVYQNIYRNPIASPSTIGATSGVSLGNMIMVLVFGYNATALIFQRYALCMLLTFAITAVVVILGRYMGFRSNSFSVVEMLMLGSIIARMINAFNTYMMYNLSTSQFIAYQHYNLGINQDISYPSMGVFLLLIVGSMIVLLKTRNRLNVLSMDQTEAKAAGISLFREQVLAQVLAAVLISAACIQCGDIGIFALVVPHFVRYIVGSDFRKLAVYSAVIGGILFLIMRILTCFVFMTINETIPINTIVSIVMIPLFMAMMALQRRDFD